MKLLVVKIGIFKIWGLFMSAITLEFNQYIIKKYETDQEISFSTDLNQYIALVLNNSQQMGGK
jgi:hypothetical protein